MIVKYASYNDLPLGIRKRIEKIHPCDYADWVFEDVPALGNKSLLDVINDDGYIKVSSFLQKIEGYLA